MVLLLVDVLAEFKLRLIRSWGGAGKTKAEFLRENDPTFFADLHSATQLFFEKGNKEKLISITEELLTHTGGELIRSSNFQSFNFSEKTVVIQVSKILHKREYSEIVLPVNSFLNTISISSYHFITSMDGFLYLIIQNFTNSQLQKLLSKFSDEQLIDIHNFYPQSCFNTFENYQKLLLFFEFLSKEATLNLENEAFKILKGLQLLAILRSIGDMNEQEYYSFLKYLMDCWIIYCYDDILTNKTP